MNAVDTSRRSWWLRVVSQRPQDYRLAAYDRAMTVEQVAELWAQWEADEAAATRPAALCRRCGALLRDPDRAGQLLHDRCTPLGYRTERGFWGCRSGDEMSVLALLGDPASEEAR